MLLQIYFQEFRASSLLPNSAEWNRLPLLLLSITTRTKGFYINNNIFQLLSVSNVAEALNFPFFYLMEACELHMLQM